MRMRTASADMWMKTAMVSAITTMTAAVQTDIPIMPESITDTVSTEDIFQTVFLKYVLSSIVFENEEHEKAWFIRVTINACRDLLKSFFRSRTVSLDQVLEQPAPLPSGHREVLEAVLSLPEKYKDVIYLHYYEGYTAPQISRILKKNVNTVYTLLTRAKPLLCEKLADSLDLKYLDYVEALNQILEDEDIVRLLSENRIMTISVTGDDEDQCTRVLSNVQSCTENRGDIHCYSENGHSGRHRYEAESDYEPGQPTDTDASSGHHREGHGRHGHTQGHE